MKPVPQRHSQLVDVAASGAHLFPRLQNNEWLVGFSTTTAAQLGIADRLQLAPVFVPVPTTFDRIGTNLVAAAGGACAYRLALYSIDELTGVPETLVLDSGALDGNLAPGSKTVTLALTLPSGAYGIGLAVENGAFQPQFDFLTGVSPFVAANTSTPPRVGWEVFGVNGAVALPASLAALGVSLASAVPRVGLRR